MPGISIEEQTVVNIKDAEGNLVEPGSLLQIRTTRGEDILCRFVSLSGGYFVTTTVDGKSENKYRVASIEKCSSICNIQYKSTSGIGKLERSKEHITEMEE